MRVRMRGGMRVRGGIGMRVRMRGGCSPSVSTRYTSCSGDAESYADGIPAGDCM